MTCMEVDKGMKEFVKKVAETQNKLDTLQQQLATAKEEVAKPFPKEQELAEKSERLAELNALLNMDEKGPSEALDVDEGAEEPIVADSPRKPSVLGKLKEAKERLSVAQGEQGQPKHRQEQFI